MAYISLILEWTILLGWTIGTACIGEAKDQCKVTPTNTILAGDDWKDILNSSTLSGAESFLARQLFRDNIRPTECTSNTTYDAYPEELSNSMWRGIFLCPSRYQTDAYVCCCGEVGQQRCCKEDFSGTPEPLLFDNLSTTTIIIIVVSVVFVFILLVVICKICCQGPYVPSVESQLAMAAVGACTDAMNDERRPAQPAPVPYQHPSGYPAQPGPYYPAQGYPAYPGPGYPAQPAPGYPAQPAPGYPAQPAPGYPAHPGTGYPTQPGPRYPAPHRPSYPTQPPSSMNSAPYPMQQIPQGAAYPTPPHASYYPPSSSPSTALSVAPGSTTSIVPSPAPSRTPAPSTTPQPEPPTTPPAPSRIPAPSTTPQPAPNPSPYTAHYRTSPHS